MGCVVNGPGECEGADIAIFAGDRRGIIYVQGEKVANVPEEEILEAPAERVPRVPVEGRARRSEARREEGRHPPARPARRAGQRVGEDSEGQVDRPAGHSINAMASSMHEGLTERTQRVIRLARDIVRRSGIREGGDLAVLIAISEENGGIAAAILRQLKFDLRPLYLRLETLPTIEPPQARAELDIEQLIVDATAVHHGSGAEKVGTEHLLVAMIRNPAGTAAMALKAAGVTEDTMHYAAGLVDSDPQANAP